MATDEQEYCRAKRLLSGPYVEGIEGPEMSAALDAVLRFGEERDDYELVARFLRVRNPYIRAQVLRGLVGRWGRVEHLRALVKLGSQLEPLEDPNDTEHAFGFRFDLMLGLQRLADEHEGHLRVLAVSALAHLCSNAVASGDASGAWEWYDALSGLDAAFPKRDPGAQSPFDVARGRLQRMSKMWVEQASELPDAEEDLTDNIPGLDE